MSEQRSYKVTIIGDANVGKTSIVQRLCRKVLNINNTCPTIGAAFQIYTTCVDKPTPISTKMEIWDTAGQERYRSLVPMYMRGANAVILVFDLTKRDSYVNLVKYWLPQVNAYLSQTNTNEDDTVYYIIGNKYDLVEKNKNERFDIKKDGYLDRIESLTNNNYKICEVSAYTNYNIEKTFQSLAEDLVEKVKVKSEKINDEYIVIKNNNGGKEVDTGYFPTVNCCYN